MITIGFNNKKLQGVWVDHKEIENAINYWIENYEVGEKIEITFGNRVVERWEVSYLLNAFAKMLNFDLDALKNTITVSDARYPYIEEPYTKQDVDDMLEKIVSFEDATKFAF